MKAKGKMLKSEIDELHMEVRSLRDKKEDLLRQLKPINQRICEIERSLIKTYTEPSFDKRKERE